MREHIKADEHFERDRRPRRRGDRALPGRGPGLQGRADRGPGRRTRASRPSRSTATARSPTSAAARTAPAPSGSRRSSSRASPAPTGAATPTARCSRASTAPPSSRRRTSRRTSSGSSRRARATTASSAASSTCSCSPTCRPGSPFWLPNGHAHLERADRLWRDDATSSAATPRCARRSSTTSSSGSSPATGTSTATTCTSPTSRSRPMGLKPMNCPAHCQIYKHELRSYRDLPIRCAEQGLVHRHEPSGTLHGLLRVRHITQDDAHVFCTEEQIEEEVAALPRLRLLHLRAVRLRAAAGAVDAARRSGSAPTRCGTRPRRRCSRTLENERPRVRAQRGRRRLLRAEDRRST